MSKPKEDEWKNFTPPSPKLTLYDKVVPLTWHGLSHPKAGLVNLGNSCYLNASVQALMHIPAFIDFLETDKKHRFSCFSLLKCITCALNRTYLNMILHTSFKPTGLVNLVPKLCKDFRLNQQEDAQEFLLKMFDSLEEELLLRHKSKLDYCSKQTTAVGQIFGWWMITKDTCVDCKKVNKTFLPITFLPLPVARTVQDALDDYFKKEESIDDFTCTPECTKHLAVRSFEMHTYPNVLRISLNRFDNFGVKISDPIEIKKSITIDNSYYRLSSCVLHQGNTATSGHYTCLAVRPNGDLVHYDDSIVSPANEKLLASKVKCEVYILFYTLHHIKTPPMKRGHPTPLNSPTHKKLQTSPVKRLQTTSPMKGLEKKTTAKVKIFSPKIIKKKIGNLLHNQPPPNENIPSSLSPKCRKNLFSALNDDHNYSFSEQIKYSKKTAKTLIAASSVVPHQIVEPIKIGWVGRADPKETDSQSDHVYFLSKNKPANTPGVLKDSENIAASLVTRQVVEPIKIGRKGRVGPKETASQSEHEYYLANNKPANTPAVLRDSKNIAASSVTHPVVKPIKIGWKGRVGPKETASQSEHEYYLANSESASTSGILRDSEHTADSSLTLVENPTKLGFDDLFENNEIGSEEFLNFHFGTADSSLTPVDNPTKTGFIDDLFANNEIDSEESVNFDIDSNLDKFRIPYVPVQLLAEDVKTANLKHSDLGKNKHADLKKWLEFRGIPNTATKAELQRRVENRMALNNEHNVLDPKVDGGIHYREKRNRVLLSQDVQVLDDADIFPEDGWDVFPSRSMPSNFNFGSVFYYLIETMPQMNDISTSSDISDDDDSEDQVEVVTVRDPFESDECCEINNSKKLRRGLKYVKSKFVVNIQDILEGKVHLYSGEVRASMASDFYLVRVAISQASGSILRALCSIKCPQRALRRCSHISALLLSLLLHKNLNGPEAITCTSKPCTWNRGSLKHDPSEANQRQYESFKVNVLRRSNFDPRPAKYQSGPTDDQKYKFLLRLNSYKDKETHCYFQTILKPKDDFTQDVDDIWVLRLLRTRMYIALSKQIQDLKPSTNFVGAFEVQGTKEQSSSEKWSTIRSLCCSARPSHQIDKFRSESAKMNFLKSHLWRLNREVSEAMEFGIQHEADARLKYAEKQTDIDPTTVVEVSGLYLHTEHVGLSCSPDGIKKSDRTCDKLLEIKCLFSMKDQDPNDFEKILSKDQLSSFCLKRNERGVLELKKNHLYYDQVQFSMGLLGLLECDLFLYTLQDSITVPVPFNETRWFELQKSLKKFHWMYLVPEYFAQRTPFDRYPIKLD